MRWQDDRSEDRLEDALKRFLQDIADHTGEFPEAVSLGAPLDLAGPAVSIREVGENYLLLAELPGVEAANLKVTATGRRVRLEGLWRSAEEGIRPVWHLNETRQGPFQRTVTLPGPVVGDSARAILSNGLLEISLAKATGADEDAFEVSIP